MVLDHPARSLAQQIQPRCGIHRHDPVILLCAWFCWEYLGYWLEQPLISLCRSVMGLWGDGDFQAASFADLWRNGFGMPYEQRNSLVVGFIMGFAVIPVIFTISEDALSNVPLPSSPPRRLWGPAAGRWSAPLFFRWLPQAFSPP